MLLDTNIVSYIYRSDTRAGLYTPHLTGQTLYLAFMTLAELLRWPLDRNWSAVKAQHYSLPLVTHNRRHFEGIPGLNLISEA